MASAAWRPEAMARTTSEAPRAVSPAAKTPCAAGHRRLSISRCCRARRAPGPALDQPAVHDVHEAHRQQHQVHLHGELACRAARCISQPLAAAAHSTSHAVQLGRRASPAPESFLVSTLPAPLAALLVARCRCAGSAASCGQGCRRVAVFGRLGQDLELVDLFGALAAGGADAVAAGVAAADDDARPCRWRRCVARPAASVAGVEAVLLRQEVHGEVDALRARGRAPSGRAAAPAPMVRQHGVERAGAGSRRRRPRRRRRRSGTRRPRPHLLQAAVEDAACPA